jgi:hypothetical protein
VIFQVLTLLSLLSGALGMLPWLGVLTANVMALAGLGATRQDPSSLLSLVAMAFVTATTLWPLSWLLSMGLAFVASQKKRHGLAFLLSLTWLAWILVCMLLFAAWGALEGRSA